MTTPCVDPSALREGDIAAYVEGLASAQVVAHVARCPACAAEAAAMQAVFSHLSAYFFRWDCPSAERLLHYQAALLPDEARRQVAAHLSECRDCQREAADLSVTRFPTLRALVSELLARGQTFLTGFRLPLGETPATRTGVDLALTEGPALYEAGAYHLLLQLAPAALDPARLDLEGWITQPSDPSQVPTGSLHLLQETAVIREGVLDEMGYFALSDLPPATYTLQVQFTDALILIHPLQVAHGAE